MIKIKFSSQSKWPWLRQTPGRKGIWGDCQFYIGDEDEDFDYWFVHEGISGVKTARCPKENVFFITGEPPTVKTYNPFFLRQFAKVISHQPIILHRNVMNWQPGLPWMVGGRYLRQERRWADDFSKDYDELKGMGEIKKDKMVSVITSNKYITKGHRLRLDFVRMLSKALGSEIDTFITSEVDLEDKWDGISRYKYHVVIENDICPDFWTEKLADSYLGLSLPLYYGCPNISRYFPSGSYVPIDIKRPEAAITQIRDILSKDPYAERLADVMVSKDLVLDKYNVFAMIAGMCTEGERDLTEVTIRPELGIPRKIGPANLLKKAVGITGINK